MSTSSGSPAHATSVTQSGCRAITSRAPTSPVVGRCGHTDRSRSTGGLRRPRKVAVAIGPGASARACHADAGTEGWSPKATTTASRHLPVAQLIAACSEPAWPAAHVGLSTTVTWRGRSEPRSTAPVTTATGPIRDSTACAIAQCTNGCPRYGARSLWVGPAKRAPPPAARTTAPTRRLSGSRARCSEGQPAEDERGWTTSGGETT